MSVLINLSTSANPFAGGADVAAGTGEEWKITGSGTFRKGDQITIQLTDSQTGVLTQLGAGNITGIAPNFCFTYNNKEYLINANTVYFSAIGDPTTFNDPTAAGNGFISMSDWFSTPEPLTGIGPFQGKLAFISRRNTQIWSVDPDPANYAQTQVLPNVGTIAPLTIQPVGDDDLYLVSDNGVRSLRVRVASNNASVADVGVPIDLILQPILATLTDAQKALMCGIIEPSSNRYWAYIPGANNTQGYIYVFSKFGDEITAWTTYLPSYNVNGTQTPFIPEKFITYQGQVWVRSTTGLIFQYGGSNNNTYDNCGVSAKTPYFDGGKSSVLKTYTALDAGFQGTWAIGFSPDYVLQNYKSIYTNTVSSFKLQRIDIASGQSTHYSLSATESSSGYARLSSLFVNVSSNYEK